MLYDAIVIGGGPGGATAALLLARAGWSVVLLERKTFPRRKVCGEYLSATNLPLLQRLGLAERFRALAGPSIRRVGLFAAEKTVLTDLPTSATGDWGRAFGREHLDTWLVEEAAKAGAEVWQPWTATSVWRDGDRAFCRARSTQGGATAELCGRVVVAAHGSWDAGVLTTEPPRRPSARSDLFGFKAHFTQSSLPEDLMPLLVFPGGYGGMVHCDDGRVSLSCCVRRDRLTQLRRRHAGPAAEVVFEHIVESCRGVRLALAGARREDGWLAAGPIQPGIRLPGEPGLFPVGNAAGEAHPVIAEGISMALQSSWLLADRLIAWHASGAPAAALSHVGNAYARSWHQHFAARLHVSRAVAAWAMRPAAVAGALPILRTWPTLLNWGARLSGKATCLTTG